MFVRKRYPPGTRCPYCGMPFVRGEPIKICAACLQPYHPECWQANGGCVTDDCVQGTPRPTSRRPTRIHPRPQPPAAEVLEVNLEDLDDSASGEICGATTRRGRPCRRPAGWGTDHPGVGRCWQHAEALSSLEASGMHSPLLPQRGGSRQDAGMPSSQHAAQTLPRESSRGTCPYCRFPIQAGQRMWVCPGCGIPHHAECFAENGGCTTYACRFAPAADALVSRRSARTSPLAARGQRR